MQLHLDITHKLHLESTSKLKSLVAFFNEEIKNELWLAQLFLVTNSLCISNVTNNTINFLTTFPFIDIVKIKYSQTESFIQGNCTLSVLKGFGSLPPSLYQLSLLSEKQTLWLILTTNINENFPLSTK